MLNKDVAKIAEDFMFLAQKNMERDKHLASVAILLKAGAVSHMLALAVGPEKKRAAFAAMAEYAQKEQVDHVIVIGEAWNAEVPQEEFELWNALGLKNHPKAKEIVSVFIMKRGTTESVSCTCEFDRELSRVMFGQVVTREAEPMIGFEKFCGMKVM